MDFFNAGKALMMTEISHITLVDSLRLNIVISYQIFQMLPARYLVLLSNSY